MTGVWIKVSPYTVLMRQKTAQTTLEISVQLSHTIKNRSITGRCWISLWYLQVNISL